MALTSSIILSNTAVLLFLVKICELSEAISQTPYKK
jgi:hypothetical protein